jgi:glutathione S-transferase
MALELYYSPYSTCSQKVRLCLFEKGTAWEDRIVDLARSEQMQPEYLAINPNAVVPALVDGGRPVTESSVILEYLEEIISEPALAPRLPYERARMRSWLRFFDEIPTSYIRYPSLQAAYLDQFQQQDPETFHRSIEAKPVRKYLYRKIGTGGFPDSELEAAFDALRMTVERVSAAVTQTPWIMGAEYSLAECAIIPVIDRLQDLGLAGLWRDLPPFSAWWARCTARPSHTNTYTAGARLSEYFPDVRQRAAEIVAKLQARTGRALLEGGGERQVPPEGVKPDTPRFGSA